MAPLGGLQTGTVTFLFTDIEGSTALLKQLRERYAAILAEHRRLLQTAFGAHDGQEVDNQGDSFFFAFRRAKQAVAAAADAQRALAAHPWPDGAQVRVRMGIHTGEAELDDGRYHGVAVHRAARVGAAGHGGQVLVSQTTHDLISDEEAEQEGLSLRDLGLRRLKDLDRPVRLYQLDIDGLPSEFPPLRTVGRVREPRRRRLGLFAAALIGVIAAAVAVPIFQFGGDSGGSAAEATVVPNSVAILDPKSGKVVGDVPIDARSPAAITAGDGAVWVASLDDNTITRIDPAARTVTGTIPLNGTPTGLAAANGLVWAATGNSETGNVYRISSLYNRVTGTAHVAVELLFLHSFGSRTVAAHGNQVWVGNLDATALKINPQTDRQMRKVVIGGGHAPGIALGFGSVWIGTDNLHELDRIDLATGAVTATIPVGGGPSNIAVGAGAVWVTNRLDDTVARVDPAANAVVREIDVGRHPLGIAVTPGAVWVANSRDGTISRIDPRTNGVRSIPIGDSPTGIAVADGLLWVTVAGDPLAQHTPAELDASGGIARIDLPWTDFDSTDPAFAYSQFGWQLEQATCAKLLNYPDKPVPAGSLLVAEVAATWPQISAGGKTYTFRIRKGFKFSPPSNAPVTAATFKYTIERTLNPTMRSPLVSVGYVNDITGAKAYEAGKTSHIAGVVARGDTLTIRLDHPDPALPTKLALPFFCAVPIGTPSDPKGLPTVAGAGPYYLASHTPGRSVMLKRNPNYHGSRPHRLAEIDYALDIGDHRSQTEVEAGKADYSQPVLAGVSRLRSQYGPPSAAAHRGRQRFFENPIIGLAYLALNTRRPLFSQPRMRRAVSFAIDRDALAREGAFCCPGQLVPTDQYLSPAMPGFRDANIYPLKPDPVAARRLAGSQRRHAVLYACEENPCPQLAAIVKRDLAAIGIEVEVHQFASSVMPTKEATRGEPFDIGLNAYLPDYLDPASLLNVLLSGDTIVGQGNTNVSYFDDSVYNAKLAAAAKLTGHGRYRAYGRLDIDLARNAAPLIAYGVLTARELFSSRLGCQVFAPSVAGMDLAALCLRKKRDG